MTNRDFAFDVDIGEEGALIVDAERENAVLIWGTKGGAEECAVLVNGDRLKSEAVKGGKHGELKLERVVGGEDEGHIRVVGVLGELDGECLLRATLGEAQGPRSGETYDVVFDAIDFRIEIAQLGHAAVTFGVDGDGAQVMLNSANFQNAGLHKCPSSNLFGKSAVCSRGLRCVPNFDVRIEPLVLEGLNRPEHCKASRVPCLHS